jgi:uncharacterized protein (DUF885 family)/pimeloyl-ACP methyl ester carboxylesterase
VPQLQLDQVRADLEGLPIDQFFEASYRQLRLRDPEALTYDGLAEAYGVGNDRLTNRSDAYVRETQALEAMILDLLRGYDRAALTPEQRVSYDVYEWYLDDLVRGHTFTYYDYPVNSMSYYGDQNWIVEFLTTYHPIETQKNAEDYIARLSRLGVWVDQVIEGLKLREAAGAVPPRFIVQASRQQVRDYVMWRKPDQVVLYTAFRDKVEALEGLSASDRQALLDAALAEVEGTFVPKYLELAEYLAHLQEVATDDAGVWRFPEGEAYYAYALRHETTTELTPDEVHEIGLAEVARIHAEMHALAVELGYPEELSISQLMERVWRDSEKLGGAEALAEFEALIREADQAVGEVVDLRPAAEMVVEPEPEGGNIGAYYQPAPRDGSRLGTFFVNVNTGSMARYFMPTTAYHEAVPGHHFQIALAQELDLPTFRQELILNAYVDGWALYAERLAWELGLYEDHPLGNLGRLASELLRAARLVVDTGVHAKGWTTEQGAAYYREVGMPQDMTRHVALPGQASSYMIGSLRILALRQRAMDALGDRFDIKAFHNVVLGSGSVPLSILERLVDEYIEAEGRATPNADAGYVPVFELADCQFSPPRPYDLECGYLVVPEDRTRPNGRQVRLHVVVFKSTSPDPKPDPVIYLTGGGGGNELDRTTMYLHMVGDGILEERDYIMYTQRGAGYSQPALDCPGYNDLLWELAGQDISRQERDARQVSFLLGCHDHWVDQGVDLTQYNSAANAADLEDLRIALGYEQVNLYGTSYGTKLALTAMRDHPQGIRSAIIDSVYPLQVDIFADGAYNANRAFEVLFEDCSADEHCSKAHPDLRDKLYRLIDDLNASPEPLTYDRGTVLVDGTRMMDVLFGFMYYASSIPYVPWDIDNLTAGEWGDIKPIFAAHLNAGLISWGTHWSLVCHESIPFESYDKALDLATDLPPQMADSFDPHFAFAVCASWDSGVADSIEHDAVYSDIPSLVVTGRYDPITPPGYAELAAKTLSNSFYYEFPNMGHGVVRSGGCGAEMALQFIADPTAEPDGSCLEELGGPDFQ